MTFTSEYDYLIHLLYSALHGTVPEDVPESISIEKVFKYGVTHEVANIAFLAVEKLKTLPDERIIDRWRKYYWKAVKRDAAQSKAREEILSALHSHGIYTLEVQGTVVKQYYPQSHLRMMSDLDFIIPEDKLDEAEKVMQSLGYETKNINGIEIDAYKYVIAVELHTEFFDTKSVTRVALNQPYTHTECHEDYTATVTDTTFYLFHLLHTIKHCGQRGSGLRRIIDLFYLENALKDKVDYEYIDGILKEHNFYETKKQLLAIKDRWFNGTEPEIDVSELENEILISGNHGVYENYYKHKFKQERAEGKHFVKLKNLLEFLFPPKENMYQSHPFCEKHHLPIVLCWIYRSAMVFDPYKFKALLSVLSRWKIKTK